MDIRIIAATNKNLKELISENKFREDLYYRLNVIPIHIPPLRERIEDIEDLAYLFISKYSERFHKYFDHMEPEVLSKMKLYNWSGNVRELENTIEFMINMMGENGILTLKTLPSSLLNYQGVTDIQKSAILTLEELEKREILKAIHLYGDTTAGKKLAAEKLGIGIATLYRKLASLQLSR